MTRSVNASEVKGKIIAPSSKSVAQRAVVAALLTKGTSILRNLTLCDDTSAALEVARLLGGTIDIRGKEYHVTSDFFANNTEGKELFCGESGLLTRMITPVTSLLSCPIKITGHGSLLGRPISMVEQPLRDLGISISTNNNLLPISLEGSLKGGVTRIDGSISSQLLTGLLMALPLAKQNSTVYVDNLKSKPYIGITIDLLRAFSIEVENDDYEVFRIKGNQAYDPVTYNVEGDWSGASCLLVAGGIAGSVTVSNLDMNSPQADIAILDVMKLAGAQIDVKQDELLSSVTASKSDELNAFEFDANECPDLFPAIVALASCCKGISKIKGANRLTHKESNRALTLQQEFGKLGIKMDLRDDVMLITGGVIGSGTVSSHNDHRIAMALATAALKATGEVTIEQAESVNKSYPEFWKDLSSIICNS
jgi:3-phosphoshikimate 1-carboxyvinyltransferase